MPFINLATEDELSEAVGLKLLSFCIPGFELNLRLRKGGYGYLKKKLPSFCEIARREPLLLITDLDKSSCAASLKSSWLGTIEPPENLIFRIAVCEVESWLIADRNAMKKLIGTQYSKLPRNPDDVSDPKALLLSLVKRGGSREIKRDLLPERGAVASQGLGYNTCLCRHVHTTWNIERAAERSDSLARLVKRLNELRERVY